MLTSPKDKSYGNKKQKVFIGKDSIYYIKKQKHSTRPFRQFDAFSKVYSTPLNHCP